MRKYTHQKRVLTMMFCSCLLIIPLCISAEGWVITVVDSGGGSFVSIAVDSASQPHVAYNSYESKAYHLKYARHDSSGWIIETIDTGGISYASLSLDKSGILHIGYCGSDILKYARRDSAEWFVDTIDTTRNVGKYVSIGTTSTDYLGISYYDETSGDLKFAEWDSDHWVIERVDTTGDVGRYTSLAFDKADNPHISYYDATNHCLKYARREGIEWFMTVVDTPTNAYERVGLHTSLALDTLEYPHISYHYHEDIGIWINELRYVKWNGSEWLVKHVAWGCADDFWVDGTSIALDSRDYPCIAYVVLSAGILIGGILYAEWNGVEWGREMVDSFPDGGVSLSLDTTNHPHIAYCCSGLKYATKPTSVEEDETFDVSIELIVQQNCPNPFVGITQIRYRLQRNNCVNISIYSLLGQKVRTLVDAQQNAGLHTVIWDATDNSGRKVSSGPYFLRLHAGEYTATRKLCVMR